MSCLECAFLKAPRLEDGRPWVRPTAFYECGAPDDKKLPLAVSMSKGKRGRIWRRQVTPRCGTNCPRFVDFSMPPEGIT